MLGCKALHPTNTAPVERRSADKRGDKRQRVGKAGNRRHKNRLPGLAVVFVSEHC